MLCPGLPLCSVGHTLERRANGLRGCAPWEALPRRLKLPSLVSNRASRALFIPCVAFLCWPPRCGVQCGQLLHDVRISCDSWYPQALQGMQQLGAACMCAHISTVFWECVSRCKPCGPSCIPCRRRLPSPPPRLPFEIRVRTLQSGKSLNIPLLYLHRYLRLTPAYMFALFFFTYVVPHFSWGPYWDMPQQRQMCQSQWWKVRVALVVGATDKSRVKELVLFVFVWGSTSHSPASPAACVRFPPLCV